MQQSSKEKHIRKLKSKIKQDRVHFKILRKNIVLKPHLVYINVNRLRILCLKSKELNADKALCKI